MQPTTAPVSERALIARVNRRLAKERKFLHTAKNGSRQQQNVGRFYIAKDNTVIDGDNDLAALVRRLNVDVLAPYERLDANLPK
jgi:hypothetical protein